MKIIAIYSEKLLLVCIDGKSKGMNIVSCQKRIAGSAF